MTLRPYQAAALERVAAAFGAGADGVCVVMPTGTGKTRTGAAWAAQPGKTLWVAPRRELIFQASQALRDAGLRVGVDVHVRSNQELALDGAKIPLVDRVVWDEAHHGASDTWSTLRTALPFAGFLGLTATPERGDGRGLRGLFDEIVDALPIRDAIAGGWLVPAEIVGPDCALGPGELAQSPIDAYREHAAGTSAVVFAPSVELAVQYTQQFRTIGVAAGSIDATMSATARDRWLADYASGACRVLCNVAVLTEGWDAPRTETIILARGFGTCGSYLQAVGRGLRPSEGKTRCLVLDLRGVAHIHGAPDEERTYSLDGKAIRRAGDEPDVRFCPVCGAVVSGTECEECGHSGEMRMRPPRVLGLALVRFAKKRSENTEERARTLARWLRHARAKGWRSGHAMHRFKATYGDWPSREVQSQALLLVREEVT